MTRLLSADASERDLEILAAVATLTGEPPGQLLNTIKSVEHIVRNGIKGAMVACGVGSGGSIIAACLKLLEMDVELRELYLYDTFEGMSEPTEKDKHPDGRTAVEILKDNPKDKANHYWAYSPIEDVKERFSAIGYPNHLIHFVKGKVEETIPGIVPQDIALLRLDTDWYESTLHELTHLYPRLAENGVLILDDYGFWQGCREATDRYFKSIQQVPVLHNVPDSLGSAGYYCIKTEKSAVSQARLKLAIFSSMAESPWGGSEELWAEMASYALEDGSDVHAFLPKWSPRTEKVERLLQAGIRLREWEPGQLGFIADQHKPWASYQPLIESAPEVVCISNGGLMDVCNGHIPLLVMLLETKLPYIVIIQANTDLYMINDQQREVIKVYLSNAKKVFFVSQANLTTAERQLAMSLPNATVINNPVNLSKYEAVEWPSSSDLQFASVARFNTWAKGHELLIEVLSSSRWAQRKWRLNLYGSGPDEGYLRQLVSYYGLDERITFCGTTTNVREIWRQNHLLVLPSRLEGTPLVLMEAMLCGRPAVVTDVGGNAAWVEDGINGFVAPAATVELIDAALERAWQGRASWQAMGHKSRTIFMEKHEINSGRTLLNQIRQIVKGDKEPGPLRVESVAENPLVSVVITCYNYGRYIPEALTSVIQQSYSNYEIVVVNDGSTDNSEGVINSLITKYSDKQITLINQANSGEPALARNAAIARARGKYILPLDGDDCLDPNALSAMLKVISDNTVVFGDLEEFGLTSTYCRTTDFPLGNLFYHNQLPYCSMYSKILWEACGGYKAGIRGYEDWEYWIQLASCGARFVHVDQRIIFYRKHGHSVVNDAQNRHEWLFAKIIQYHPEHYPEEDLRWSSWYLERHPIPPSKLELENIGLQSYPFVNTGARIISSSPLLYSANILSWAREVLGVCGKTENLSQ